MYAPFRYWSKANEHVQQSKDRRRIIESRGGDQASNLINLPPASSIWYKVSSVCSTKL